MLVRSAKGGRARQVTIDPETLQLVGSWAESRAAASTAPLWVRANGTTALNRDGVAAVMWRHGGAAGLRPEVCHPHALRSFCATTMAEAGVPAHVIRTVLGHGDLRTTERYLAYRDDDLERAAIAGA